MYRPAALLAMIGLLAACTGPDAPREPSRDVYAFRAPIDARGGEPVYRLNVSPDLNRWFDEHGIRNVSVFDAAGAPQACGIFNQHSFGPIESTATVSQGRIAAFDDATCKPDGALAVCFKGHACGAPDYCPHTPIDLTPFADLKDIDTLESLLAIANTAPDPCDIEGASCPDRPSGDDAHARQRLARRLARAVLARAGLGALLKPDPPPPPRTTPGVFNPRFLSTTGGGVRSALGAMMLSATPSADTPRRAISPIRLPSPAAGRAQHTAKTADAESDDYAITFDEPVTEVRLIWAPSAHGSQVGTTKTIAYDDEGRPHEHVDPLQPIGDIGSDRFEQTVAIDLHPRAVRVIVQSDLAGLRLIGATSTTRAHKPFVNDSPRQFWFVASGTPPYSVYLEKNRGMCGDSASLRRMNTYARLHDADWPPAATVGMPLANARSPFMALAASHFEIVVWLYWLAGMLVLWLAAAAFVGARWMRVRRFEARQRRTR